MPALRVRFPRLGLPCKRRGHASQPSKALFLELLHCQEILPLMHLQCRKFIADLPHIDRIDRAQPLAVPTMARTRSFNALSPGAKPEIVCLLDMAKLVARLVLRDLETAYQVSVFPVQALLV